MLSDRDTSCDCPAWLSIYNEDHRILEQASIYARNCLYCQKNLHLAVDDLGGSAASCDAYTSKMAAVLSKLRVPLNILTSDPSAVALDYEAGIRRMLHIEDASEAAIEQVIVAGKNAGIRSTKNSQGHRQADRLLYLEPDHRELLRSSPFWSETIET